METQVRTPQTVFMQPQRLIVPLFQRSYVWNQENQWEPLWNDLTRVAERLNRGGRDGYHPHFLGAVVLQQVQNATGSMQERIIIDGQQRLTTLQLLFDALHAELHAVGAAQQSLRIEALVTNQEAFWERPEDRFKVLPTNRDRGAFNAVMAAPPPVDYDALGYRGVRIVQAHRFFSEQARQWLQQDGPEGVIGRAATIERAARELLQIVIIDLTAEENAQEIFETLNARGAQLTAADLVKNFIFQRLMESGVDVEAAYEQFWKDFETGFWESEVNVGRVRYPRSSIFLNHWLVGRIGAEVVAREVFSTFKTYADFGSRPPMHALLEQVHRAAGVYRGFVDSAARADPNYRLGLFAYRTGVLESEVIKPLVLILLDPEEAPVPQSQLTKALCVVESWMVRRMLVRATTKAYNQIVAETITHLRKGDRLRAGDAIESFLAAQRGASRYWPDDRELRDELPTMPVYRRLGRGRLRMVLEAIEDHCRGWREDRSGLGEERVARGKYHIEHIMPRKWTMHWPLTNPKYSEADRERLIHTLGNLTLLTGKLNAKVSHGPWDGPGGKGEALQAHDVLMLNRDLLRAAGSAWTEESIRARAEELVDTIIQIWAVPPGHRTEFSSGTPRPRRHIELSDLLNAGSLAAGMTLYPRRRKLAHRTATLLPDGRIDVDGIVYGTPSAAAAALTGKATNGWWFFLVDQAARRSLRDVWREYVDTLAVDADEDDTDDDQDADEND